MTDQNCEYPECKRKATDLAVGRKTKGSHFCNAHAELVTDEGSPEYIVSCPLCGCGFGVN